MSYKLAGVVWNDDGTLATDKITSLEALEELKQRDRDDPRLFFEELLDIIEKDLKALEIIKEKRINVRAFLKCCHREDGLTIYNNQCDDRQEKESKELTQEEYDLLKEVLL